nr:immunoglobulin heavy chain junction region [Macaca mulatta]MOV49788.1 immunoglobulin heavy chain junction region [Macaca mulatta]MOV49857.1 immunoglobulin heavy chain junction region [Macaca mulatta]MOV50240.1 immunoglobulin heavy chain junction region [Macaca mulatta]MOV51334.1 immunoglobulin heavy chain junction region [Macaca mulatta]
CARRIYYYTTYYFDFW